MKHQVFFTPGPAELFYTVEDHMKSAFKERVMSISHRSKDFEQIYANTKKNLVELLNIPEGYDIYFTSSANEIWERIIQNLVAEKSHHFVNGSFSEKFLSFAKDYKKQPTDQSIAFGKPFTHYQIPEGTELISVTLNETSVGYAFDLDELVKLRSNHPDKLIALDVVSALPAVALDLKLVDTAYFSVQKCFGLPSGLGVWIVNKRCYEKVEFMKARGYVTGSYHDLLTMKKSGDKNQTPETPNTLAIYLLGKVAQDMNFRTAKLIQNDTIYKASILYQALEDSESLSPFIREKTHRSKTVIVAHCEGGNSKVLGKMLEKGWAVGKGYGEFKNDQIRIANFPTHSREIMEQMADLIKTM